MFAAVGSTGGSGYPQDWVAEYQQAEPVSVKERLAIYQAAVAKKETSGSSAMVRFHIMGDDV